MQRYRIYNLLMAVTYTFAFILLGFFCFKTSYLRFAESIGDLWQSCKFYFYEIFGIEHITIPTVTQYSNVLEWSWFIPVDFAAFKTAAGEYFKLLFNKENFTSYIASTGALIGTWSQVIILVFPSVFMLGFLIKRIYCGTNTKHNKDTVPLRIFKLVAKYTYHPIKNLTTSFVAYMREHSKLLTFWIVLWVFHLNLATIVVEFIAYYLYFSVSFAVGTLYVQFAKLCIDLQIIFGVVPWWFLAIIGCVIFDKFRKGIGNMQLRRMEARNCGFINELPIVSMTCGSMGRKKTTIITDMALSQEVMFRQQAFELLKKNDMKFPFFPWIEFEMEIRRCLEHGRIYNLATIKEWVDLKRERYIQHGNAGWQLYGYDTERYGETYNDGLKTEHLFDVLKSYAQLYFIYVIESSLLVSNYSIRTDNQLLSQGNFPMWATDFFPENTVEEGRHAHILDFDVLRLGKKLVEDNPNIGSFEFGVVIISEVGKERGNVLDHKEMKKNNHETNQKNDLFNSWLKMCRHSATVDHFPFIKVFTDEQRPESWGADARDLCDIIMITGSSAERLALPFYTIEDILCETLYDWFTDLYYDFRYRRGDNTLLVHILKSITSWLYKRNVKIHNRYGYCIAYIEKERGTMDGKIEKKRYFVMSKKIYSRRFNTDCFSDYFNDMAVRAVVGMDDYPEYQTEKATVQEMRMQNSYFINALYKNVGP